nr:putative nuclease HARBI1 [Leptinotarsa decemlineata]
MPHMSNSPKINIIDPRTRILVALSFYDTGSYQRLIGESHNISISQQSVSNCIRDISSLITEHLADRYVKFPTTNEERNVIKLAFHQKYNFPGVTGAVDCTHIRILHPVEEEHNFVNRKGYHSMNVQVICDSNLRILAVNPKHAGSTHDAYIWHTSAIREEVETQYRLENRSCWLLGDSGYPLQPRLMTPIVNALPNTPEGRYTQAHCSARNCIERFRCLSGDRTLRYKPEVVGQIISSCATLHNICILHNLNVELIDEVNDQLQVVRPPDVVPNDLHQEGDRVRERIIRRYFH